MKTVVAATNESLSLSRSRVVDYVELTKPRIAVLVLVTVAAGYCLAAGAAFDGVLLLNVVVGTALVAAGASVLNQLLERHTDAFMQRTENRPLPSGRLQSGEVLMFGLILGLVGLIYLAVFVQRPLCVVVAAFTFVSYVWIYTPLKRITTLNTIIGAVPGALPPIIGWSAVSATFTTEAVVLFLILFLWQVPHFLAIAWIYREDYARAGLQMLPVVDGEGRMTSRQMLVYCGCLIAVSLAPVTFGQAGVVYAVGAVIMGGVFFFAVMRFCRDVSTANARLVMRASLLYLPVVLLLLVMGTLLRI